MSLLLTAALAGLGLAAGRGLVQLVHRRRAGELPAPEPAAGNPGQLAGLPAKPNDAHEFPAPVGTFVCALGDVVLRAQGGEAWLAGGWVLAEQAPIACLFVAPEAAGDRYLYVRALPDTRIWWMRRAAVATPGSDSAASAAALHGTEAPSVLELGDRRYERARRLPVATRAFGERPCELPVQLLIAEYTCTTEQRALLVRDGNQWIALEGTELDEALYEVLPSEAGAK